jgi:hypothetical protein
MQPQLLNTYLLQLESCIVHTMADLEDEFLGFSDPESDSDEFSNEFNGFSDLESERDENTITPLDPPPTDRIFDSFEDC